MAEEQFTLDLRSSATPQTAEELKKQRDRESNRLSKARIKARKLGLPIPPYRRVWNGARPKAQTPEEKAQRAVDRKEQMNGNAKRWRAKNPDKRKAVVKASNDLHREERNRKSREHNAKPETRERKRLRKHARLAAEPQFKVQTYLSKRMVVALRRVTKGIRKQHRTITLIGCTIPELMAHLEAQFAIGMTWENYGSLWHIDHRRPCASFNLTDPNQQLECFNWSNLQPLWGVENIRKGAKLDWTPPLKKAA